MSSDSSANGFPRLLFDPCPINPPGHFLHLLRLNNTPEKSEFHKKNSTGRKPAAANPQGVLQVESKVLGAVLVLIAGSTRYVPAHPLFTGLKVRKMLTKVISYVFRGELEENSDQLRCAPHSTQGCGDRGWGEQGSVERTRGRVDI
jgi:hypothetical protein